MGNEEQGTVAQPEVTEEHRDQAKEMAKAYEDDRPTVSMPGTANTVTGQAVADWVDEDGKPKYGEAPDVDEAAVLGTREKGMADD
jgi:hypothetical protein